jgi:glutamyl-tRNA reductase
MLVVYGCNYRNAPIELRERLAFPEHDLPAALGRLLEVDAVDEGLILSTCNRVEVLARIDDQATDGAQAVRDFLCADRGVSGEELDRHSYHFVEREAVQHLFSVASGLDSMILGEPQIQGQVKQAYRIAQRAGSTGPILERLLQQCLSTAKRVRTDTGISRNAVSVAFAAVNLAKQIFGELRGRTALVIGAGKMGELVARHLLTSGVGELLVTSRTYSRAVVSAAGVGGRPVEWDDILERLSSVDIVVSCTAAPRIVLNRTRVAQAVKRRRGQPLFMIDIAVPRDIDPSVNNLDNVYLYDIDGLQGVVDANIEERRKAAQQAQEEISRDVKSFLLWRRSLEITPTIVSLRERLGELGTRELARFRRKLGQLDGDQEQVLDEMVRGLIQKILHRPVVHLRKSVERGDTDACTAMYRAIFGLDHRRSREERRGQAEESSDGSSRETRKGPGPQRIVRGGKEE